MLNYITFGFLMQKLVNCEFSDNKILK